MISEKFHINRHFSRTNNKVDYLYQENEENKSLADLTKLNNKISILGNPGSGKTEELKKLFNKLWLERTISNVVPIGINLKNFRTTDKFEDIIQISDWLTLPSIIFILDGIDEIPNIPDFISAFSFFKAKYHNKNYKYVLSCRTNIYFKYLSILSDFEVFYLQDLTLNESKQILKNNYNIDLNDYKIQRKQLDFLTNPFNVNLVGEYLNSKSKNGKIDINSSIVWDICFNERLNNQKINSLNKEYMDIPKLKNELTQVAFVLELIQKNYITESELYEILGECHIKFSDNPFLESESSIENSFKFTHRQFQEYLVSVKLSKLNFKQVINIITIKNIKRVHPSFYNICTFLLNILEYKSKFYVDLLNWLFKYEPLLLLTADLNRIEQFREKVFQEYFITHCVEKTMWIGVGELSISKEDLGRFANSRQNFEFLIPFIKNNQLNQRIRISSIELIGYFNCVQESEVQELFFDILKNKKENYEIKRAIIFSIEKMKLHIHNKSLIDEIISIFKFDSSSIINSAISSLFNEIDNLDPWFDYFKIEFERIIGIRKRKNKDKINYFNGTIGIYKLQKFSDDNFSKLSILILNTGYRHFPDYESSYWKKLAIEVLKRNSKFLKMLVNLFSKKEYQFHANRDLIVEIIVNSNCQIKAFKQILGLNNFAENKWNLAAILDNECLKLLIEINNEKPFETIELNHFRFILLNSGKRDLALILQDKLIEAGIEFTNFVQNEKQIEINKKIELDLLQEELKLFFDKDILFDRIQNYVSINKIENLSWEEIHKLEKEFHKDDFTWSRPIPIELQYLKFINIEKGNIHFIGNYISDDYQRLKFLYRYLKDNKDNIDFSRLNDDQLESMILSFKSFQKTINIKDISIHQNYNSFQFKSHKLYLESEKLKTFFKYYRFKEFQLTFDDNFLAECIEYYPLFNERYEREELEIFCERIKDKNILKEQLIKNLKQNMVSMTFKPQSRIALKYNYTECYPLILKFLKVYEHIDSNDELLIEYLNKTNDSSILKYRTEKMNSYSSWYILEILLDKYQDSEYVLQKSKEYLKYDETQFSEFAFMFLFKLNDESAIDLFLSRNGFTSFNKINDKYFENYSHFKVDHIESFFNLTLSIEDSFNKSSMFFILNIMVAKNSKSIVKAEETQNKLIQIKNKLSKKDSTYDSKFFYLNMLIDHSKQALINQLSKPLTFREALKKTNELITF